MLRLITAIFHEKNGTVKMIFGSICVVCGCIMFFVYDFFLRPTRRSGILEYLAHNLGHYGFALIYILPGLLLLTIGLVQRRKSKTNLN